METKINAIRVAKKNLEKDFYERKVNIIRGSDYVIASIWGRFSEGNSSYGGAEELYEVYFFLPRRPSNSLIFLDGCLAEALGLVAGVQHVTDQIREINKNGIPMHHNNEYDAQLKGLLLNMYPERSGYLKIVHVGRIGEKRGRFISYRLPAREEVEQLLNKDYIVAKEFSELDPMTQIVILYLSGILKKDVIYEYYYDQGGVALYFGVLTLNWFIRQFGGNHILLRMKNEYRWIRHSDPDLCRERRHVRHVEKDSNHVTIEYEFMNDSCYERGTCYEGQIDIRIEPFNPHLVSWFRALE